MPVIRPFRGILYNSNSVVVSSVVAPPYDVINADYQNELYARDPHNIVRLILGREENRYDAAARSLREWMEAGILQQDDEPCIYAVRQSFVLPDGRHVDRRGFIAACELEEVGKGSVLPHEKTHSKPKEDRFKLFTSTGAMFSQIFSIFTDDERFIDPLLEAAMRGKPSLDLEFEGVRNRVWKISEPNALDDIVRVMKGKTVLVADGHHRYETALLYRDMMRAKSGSFDGTESFNFVPMFFTNMRDPGLVIFPTHRLVHSLPSFSTRSMLEELQKYFHADIHSSEEELLAALTEQRTHAFGLVLPSVPQCILLWLKDSSVLRSFGLPDVLAQLDVTILHRLILNGILGITDEQQEKKLHIDYEKDSSQAAKAVMSGKAQAAFLMNPTTVDEVRLVAEAGLTMPQKSTYFYPKLLSGLVTYSFLDSRR